MTDHADDGRWDRADAAHLDQAVDGADGAGLGGVEAYESDGGTVFYESENPLAWMQSSEAVTLRDSA